MGISGLLPLLKSIQVQRHLSEFQGQTLAVDGYVWLHRGSYTCATELATGKNTSKYVEYAMKNVRLLQHYGITPYLVFDGGPLPAKRGTEKDREQRRQENLERGNVLAAQGRHSQARDFYTKCVDVTPQMAYQLIKALKAENVPYIVAPYEADAQLAWLERQGIVQGIITEDSDLLVFGCQNVHFKLDSVNATITSISRSQFSSVTATSPFSNGLSLQGWSDVEFRAMAILSGCDYLPSVPGVGLKTAWTLLRKHGKWEKVVRALRLEGKKEVPRGYEAMFKRAEKVFLHQRVYDPTVGALVCLGEIPEGDVWSEEDMAYIGEDIPPELAKRIATGDACPVSRLPMEDINPSYSPLAFKSLNNSYDHNRSAKTKGKMPEKAKAESILKFFGPRPESPTKRKGSTEPIPMAAPTKKVIAGRSSGKRTLAEVMYESVAAKRSKREEEEEADTDRPTFHSDQLENLEEWKDGTEIENIPPSPVTPSSPSRSHQHPHHHPHRSPGKSKPKSSVSKFFAAAAISGPSRPRHSAPGYLEANTVTAITTSSFVPTPVSPPKDGSKYDDLPSSPTSSPSDAGADVEMDMEFPEPEDPVEQEDGYISPGPSGRSRDSTPDLSSPARPGSRYIRRSHPHHSSNEERTPEEEEEDLFCGADILSSPALDRSDVGKGSSSKANVHRGLLLQKVVPLDFGVFNQRRTGGGHTKSNSRSDEGGLDLRGAFNDGEDDEVGEGEAPQCSFGSTASSGTPGPSTPIPIPTPSLGLLQRHGQASSSQELGVGIRDSPSGLDGDWIDEEIDLEGKLDGSVESSVLEDFRKRQDAVAQGWRKKFGYDGGAGGGGGGKFATPAARRAPPRRRETTITPNGLHRPSTSKLQRPQSAPSLKTQSRASAIQTKLTSSGKLATPASKSKFRDPILPKLSATGLKVSGSMSMAKVKGKSSSRTSLAFKETKTLSRAQSRGSLKDDEGAVEDTFAFRDQLARFRGPG